jgi:ribosomal-protein-alanine N-acetyltransferase
MPTNTTIRSAILADIPRLVALDADGAAEWDEAAFAGEFALAWSHVDVLELAPSQAEQAVQIVGFVVFWCVADELQILNIAVDPAHRRAGFGRSLMAHLVATARAGGQQRLVLEVRESNRTAQAFYQAHGFVTVGERRGYYKNGEAAVLMECHVG